MADNESRITLSIHEGKLEIVGSEDFVAKQVDRFEDLIKQLFASPQPPQPRFTDREVSPNPNGAASRADLGAGLGDYPNVFAVHDDKIQITKDLPGPTIYKKMLAAAELYALASSLRGTEEVPFEEIRNVCREHGCLDSDNFSPTIKKEKELFTFGGKRGSPNQTLKLTVPGKKAARELAKQLNDA